MTDDRALSFPRPDGASAPAGEVFEITDAATFRAIAHPLRMQLLGWLRVHGPATASQLARQFGESSGSTSYHLRQLARFGFIEEDAEQPSARERRWRARHRFTSWSGSRFSADSEGRAAVALIREQQHELVRQAAARFEARTADWSSEWVDAAGQRDTVAMLTPGSLRSLASEISELIQRYDELDRAKTDTKRVLTFFAGYPYDTEPS